LNPEHLRFAKTHEWVHVEEVDGAKIATIGLSAFAIEQLTDLVFIELPEVGAQAVAGETFGEIESVKAVSDVYSPVTGEIIEVNSSLPDMLETIGDSPYSAGWMIKVRLSDDTGLADLLDYATYQQQCAEEG